MAEWTRKQLAGWGRLPVLAADVARPETTAAARLRVEECARDCLPLVPYGLGRSYGDAALIRDGRAVLTRRLDRILSFDPATGWLHAEAGVSIADLLSTFVPRGFFPPVTPGTRFVTLGGAFACDVHGKNHHGDGCFSNHVRSLELLLASGEVRTVTRESDPETFTATAGGMGLTGLILSLELKLAPIASPLIEVETERVPDLDTFFSISRESAGFTHTVAWLDCLARGRDVGRGIFIRGRHAPSEATRSPGILERLTRAASPLLAVPFDAPNALLNRATITAFNAAYYYRHPRGTARSLSPIDPFFYPLDAVTDWNRIYGGRGFYQYQMVLPPDPGHAALRELLSAIGASGLGSFLAVLKEFGPTDNGGLSFPRAGVTLALDFPNHGAPLLSLFERLDAITLSAGGRVYLGKDARLSRATFRRMYPGWEAWRATRDRLDPGGVFQSELGRRLGLSGDT
jgi:decaprenylphospho-beta-D-ribofuranose 2-oxidase